MKDLADQDMTGDRVEGLGNIYGCYKGSNGRFGVIKAFKNHLHEQTQQSGDGVEGPEAMLGRGNGEEAGNIVKNEFLEDIRGVQSKEIGR